LPILSPFQTLPHGLTLYFFIHLTTSNQLGQNFLSGRPAEDFGKMRFLSCNGTKKIKRCADFPPRRGERRQAGSLRYKVSWLW
jgi:hypothetical protein